ncbi:hypothetical protein ACM714_20545 [Pseudomonas aeruginosa]
MLLTDVIKFPLKHGNDDELCMALKSQAGIAKLKRTVTTEQGDVIETISMSLNTLKSYAETHLDGGFQALNNLRRKAAEAIQFAQKREERANKRTRSGLTLKVAQLEYELELHRQTNMILTRALSECLGQFVNIRDATNEHIRRKYAQDATDTLHAILSLAIPPFNIAEAPRIAPPSADITNISDYRKE